MMTIFYFAQLIDIRYYTEYNMLMIKNSRFMDGQSNLKVNVFQNDIVYEVLWHLDHKSAKHISRYLVNQRD